MKTLVLGAGEERIEGAVHVDELNLAGIDVVWDLDRHPWPLQLRLGGPYDRIVAHDVVEHLRDTLAFMDACWDLCALGGRLELQVPDWAHEHAWIDPTHVRAFHRDTFDYFDPETELGQRYGYYTAKKWRIVSKQRCGWEWRVELERRCPTVPGA